MSRAAALVLVLAVAARAHAEPRALADARTAVREVRYDAARALLDEALATGELGPGELAELYRLAAATALVLRQPQLAEQLHRQWLALDPAADLPDSVAPAVRASFLAARAYVDAHGRLAAHVRTLAPGEAELVIDADPLRQIAAAAVLDGARRDQPQPIQRARSRLRVPRGADARVALLDAQGNRLRELAVPPPPAPPTPLLRRPIVWLAGAGAAATGGLVAAWAARRADHRLADVLAHPEVHYQDAALRARDRRDRDAAIADLAFGAAGALAITGAVMYWLGPPARHELVPLAAPDAIGVAIVRRY